MIKTNLKNNFMLVALLIVTQLGFAQVNKNVGDFTAVKVFDKISAQLVPSSESKIEIKGEGAEKVEVVNKNGDLKIRMPLDKFLKGEDITVIIHFKNIESIEASEGAYVSSEATLKGVDFTVNANKGGQIKVILDVKKAGVRATTGGVVKLSGKAQNQDIVINSGGIVNAKTFETSQTTVAVNAGGEADVFATDLVDAKTRAGGDITVYGNPKKVNQKTFAGGNIDIIKK